MDNHAEGIHLEAPISSFLRGFLTTTGAERGALILEGSQGLQVESHMLCQDKETPLFAHLPLETQEDLPKALIQTSFETSRVIHSMEAGTWDDPYIAQIEGRSWMCTPIRYGDRVIGVLYLEGQSACQLGSDSLDQLANYLSHSAENLEHPNPVEEALALRGELNASQEQRKLLEDLVAERTRELEAAQKELVRKERLATLGQLIATVSHELRNPLGTVRGSVFLIANKLLGKDLGVERALDRAERNIVRCDRIIEDLLAYTRSQDLQLEDIRVDPWLENMLEEYTFPHDVTVQLRLGANARFQLEPERLRRCMINIINNACDAMGAGKDGIEDGSKVLAITSRINPKRERLEIIVTDTGPGMDATQQRKILEPLYSTKSFGVGLGLPTVVQIMEQHQGGLEIRSKVGVGTSMLLWVPNSQQSPLG